MRTPTWYADFDAWIVEKTLSTHLHLFCDWGIHPNVLTAVSLALAAAIPWLHFRGAHGAVAAALVGRQVLDCLDGEVARRCGKTSRLGAALDALGDAIYFFDLVVLATSYAFPKPGRALAWAAAIYAGLAAVHLAFCRAGELLAHAVKTYDTPSLYRKTYAYLVNNSLPLSGAAALLYLATAGKP